MFDQEVLAHIWFVILWAVFASYLVLDGFDFGVGVSYLFGTGSEKREFRSAIGPFWDGNETWLVLFAGILFAAFPLAYGNFLSTYYVSTFLLLFALIFRGASLEFRSLVKSYFFQKFWDLAFFSSSVFVPMLIGVVSSNCLQAIAANHSLKNAPSSILNAESVLSGLFLLSLLGLHGSNFMQLRATNDLKRKCSKFSLKYCFSSMACLICMTFLNGNTIHFDFAEFSTTSLVGLMIMIIALGTMYWSIWKQKRVCSFLLSSIVIVLSVLVYAASIYPNLTIVASAPNENITILDSMSSQSTLQRMLLFAVIGMPFVFAYTYMSYRTFWKP